MSPIPTFPLRIERMRRRLLGGLLAWGLLPSLRLAAAAATDELPALKLGDAQGRPVDLAALTAGKPAVVNLWATWCPHCRDEMPMLAAAQQRHPGVRFVFVNQGEAADKVARYLDDELLSFDHLLLDPGSRLSPLVGARGLPTTLFVDARGRVVERHVGALTRDGLAEQLGRLERGGRSGTLSAGP